MKNKTPRISGTMLVLLGHLTGVFVVAAGIAFLILPISWMKGLAYEFSTVDRLWEMSSLAVFLHVGLSACVWALSYILFQLARIRMQERKVPATVRLKRGGVMTETIIIMPIYLGLTFGMGQLAINNVGGILANVAAYEAARAAWIWMPEAAAGRMGVTNDIANEKCRVAVAFVMMPVAPGDFLKNSISSLGTYADKARMLAFGANIPGAGIISTSLPDFAGDLTEAGVRAIALGDKFQTESSYAVTLDNSSFVFRSVRKFTQAYLGTECDIDEDTYAVTMRYRHLNGMPFVGRIFGTGGNVGGSGGYYSTYERSFGLRRQFNTPNTEMPANSWIDWGGSDPRSGNCPPEVTTGCGTDFDTSGYE